MVQQLTQKVIFLLDVIRKEREVGMKESKKRILYLFLIIIFVLTFIGIGICLTMFKVKTDTSSETINTDLEKENLLSEIDAIRQNSDVSDINNANNQNDIDDSYIPNTKDTRKQWLENREFTEIVFASPNFTKGKFAKETYNLLYRFIFLKDQKNNQYILDDFERDDWNLGIQKEKLSTVLKELFDINYINSIENLENDNTKYENDFYYISFIGGDGPTRFALPEKIEKNSDGTYTMELKLCDFLMGRLTYDEVINAILEDRKEPLSNGIAICEIGKYKITFKENIDYKYFKYCILEKIKL